MKMLFCNYLVTYMDIWVVIYMDMRFRNSPFCGAVVYILGFHFSSTAILWRVVAKISDHIIHCFHVISFFPIMHRISSTKSCIWKSVNQRYCKLCSGNTLVSYLSHLHFELKLGHQQLWLRDFVVFLSPSKHMTWLGHKCFLPNRFLFIMYQSLCQLIIRILRY